MAKLPTKFFDCSIANALNRVSAFNQRRRVLEAEIYDDLLPTGPHVLFRFLFELINEKRPHGIEVERSSQHEENERAPLSESNVLVAGVIKEEVEQRRRIAVVDFGHHRRSQLGVPHLERRLGGPRPGPAQEFGEARIGLLLFPLRRKQRSVERRGRIAQKLAPKANELLIGLGGFQDFVQARQKHVKLLEHQGSEGGALFHRHLQSPN